MLKFKHLINKQLYCFNAKQTIIVSSSLHSDDEKCRWFTSDTDPHIYVVYI